MLCLLAAARSPLLSWPCARADKGSSKFKGIFQGHLSRSINMAAPTEWYRDNYLISTSPNLIQYEAINIAFGTSAMYWTRSLEKGLLKKMLNSSLCFGVYELPSSTSAIAGLNLPYHVLHSSLTICRTWKSSPNWLGAAHHRSCHFRLSHRRLYPRRIPGKRIGYLAYQMC